MRVAFAGLLIVAAASADVQAEAEHYENVRVDAGVTGSTTGISGRNGSGMVVEIKGMAHDNIGIGARVEMAVMFGGELGNDNTDVGIAMAASGVIKAEYLLGREFVRPFVGLGAGGYSINTIGTRSSDQAPNGSRLTSVTGRYFGVAPQVGVDLGPVRIAATYNAILGAQLELIEDIGGVDRTTHHSQNFLSIELSYQFAGGRKQAPAVSRAPTL